MSDGARGSKGRDGMEGRKGSGRGSPRAGDGRSTEMINASKSPPFASPTYLPTLPVLRLFLPTYLPTYLHRDLDPRALSRNFRPAGAGERARIMPRTLRGRNFPSARPSVSTRSYLPLG